MRQYSPKKPDDSFLDMPILEGEECWAMRVIDESQKAPNPKLVYESTSSETHTPPNSSDSIE